MCWSRKVEMRDARWKKVKIKSLKVNDTKTKALCTTRMEAYKFHAQYEEEEWEETQFQASTNVTIGCVKDTTEYKSAKLRQTIL